MDFHNMATGTLLAIAAQNKIMVTTSKVLLLFLMHGSPPGAAILPKLKCNIKEIKQFSHPIHFSNNTKNSV